MQLPRPRSLLLATGLILAMPGAAQAATLAAGKSCFDTGSKARLEGSGFAPDSPIEFTVNGRRLTANVTSDSNGDVAVSYQPPATKTERKLVIEATDAEDETAKTTIFVTEFAVTAQPARSDNVRQWRAVFRLYGFRRGKAFIHYVNPNGRFQKTVRLGRLRGPCGRLKTAKRRVLPFDNPQFGSWKLQFDTHRRFSRRTAHRRVIPVQVFRG